MTVFTSGFKVGKSVAVAAGMMILPVMAGAMKPAAKAGIKGCITAYGIIKASAAGTVEILKDIADEAKAELSDSGE